MRRQNLECRMQNEGPMASPRVFTAFCLLPSAFFLPHTP